MLWLFLLPPYVAAFSWSSLFGTASNQYIFDGEEAVTTPLPGSYRVAIVGAGAGGSSAAFWINKAAERLEKDIVIDVYERSEFHGGRSTVVYPHDDTSLRPVELGASIFIDANKNMVRASHEFNLEIRNVETEELNRPIGVWDGSKFVATLGAKGTFEKIWENFKLAWRYGFLPPKTVEALSKKMVDQVLNLYTSVTYWTSVEELSNALNLTELVNVDAATYIASKGIKANFAHEIIEAATRVNYGQNLEDIHALGALVCMAASDAKALQDGNYRAFEGFLSASKANVHLNSHVNSLKQASDKKWTLTASKNGETLSQTYDSVILAGPFHKLDIDLPKSVASVAPVSYVRLHVTLLTTTDTNPNPSYFGLPEGTKVPGLVLTTSGGHRSGGPPPAFNSLSFLRKVAEDSEEWVVKIFSAEVISDETLASLFTNVGWVYRKEWDAYPRLFPGSPASYGPMKLAQSLYYVNGFEQFISTMETETIASRGVANLLLKESFGEGICPTGYSAPPPEGTDFVWGFDC